MGYMPMDIVGNYISWLDLMGFNEMTPKHAGTSQDG